MKFPAGAIPRGSALFTLLVAVLGFTPVPSAQGEVSIPGLTAAMTRPAYPMLIRNAACPLARVIIEVGKVTPDDVFERNDVRLTSMAFTIRDSGSLDDFDSLILLASGDDDEFRQGRRHTGLKVKRRPTATSPVGAPAAPAATILFQTDEPLAKGRNVFWLSGHLKTSAGLYHRLAATCTSIGTTAGSLTPKDESPGVRQRIGIALRKSGDDGVDTYAIPALATTPRGTLLAVYDMRWRYPGHDLQDQITTGLSRSTDGGQTWEPVRVIMDMGKYGNLPPEQNGCSDPGIIVDRQTGEIFAFSVWMHGKPHHHQWEGNGSAPGYEIGVSPQFLMVRSRDDGRTWSQPENMTCKLKRAAWWLLAPSPQQGIQIADGTLVMPIEGRDETGKEFATVMTSRDHGANWTVGAPISGCDECQAVELGDGSIMLNMRNERQDDTFPYRAVFVSRDLGRSWQPHGTDGNTLIEANCNASLLRVDYEADGAKRHVLLFTNPHTQVRGQRTHQTLQVSFDDGRTWPRDHDILLDESLGWGYPSLSRIDADHIGLVYGGSQADVVFQAVTLAELLR